MKTKHTVVVQLSSSNKPYILISTEIASYLAPVGITLMWSFNRALARIASSRKVLSPRV